MKKVFVKVSLFILGVLLVLTPLTVFIACSFGQNHIYSKTYYAALVDKCHNLYSQNNKKKIVLIGGSNVAFGFESALIENEFPDYKVVNFGLYAALGTKIMLDLALDSISQGDLVFVIPEISDQSMSLYFNANATLKAIEDDFSLINKLSKDNKEEVLSNYFSFAVEKLKYDNFIDPGETVYRRNNFNSYGDICYGFVNELDEFISLRTSNIIKGKKYSNPKIDYLLNSNHNQFFNYLNDYNRKVASKGASLYYSFSPVNNLAVNSTVNEIIDYYWALRSKLSFPVIGTPSEFIIDSHYFYDTNFHTNDAGAIYRTYLFVSNLFRDVYKINKVPSFNIPEPPDYAPVDITEEDDSETCNFFVLEENDTGYSVVSIKDEFSELAEVTMPEIYNHKYVNTICEKAFTKSKSLKKIIIPESYGLFENGSFDDCLTLTDVYLEQRTPTYLIVDYTGGLLNNVSNDFKFYIPADCLNAYKADYNWQFYSQYLIGV